MWSRTFHFVSRQLFVRRSYKLNYIVCYVHIVPLARWEVLVSVCLASSHRISLVPHCLLYKKNLSIQTLVIILNRLTWLWISCWIHVRLFRNAWKYRNNEVVYLLSYRFVPLYNYVEVESQRGSLMILTFFFSLSLQGAPGLDGMKVSSRSFIMYCSICCSNYTVNFTLNSRQDSDNCSAPYTL